MPLNSQIYRGEVTHERITPVRHAFSYPMTFFAFDLSELPILHQDVSYFGYNEKKFLTLNDSDYLHGSSEPIIDQLDPLIGPQHSGQRTLLVTSPRYFGYAFNPVNFHLRLKDEQLIAAVAEVNNTFGDRHVYPLKTLQQTAVDTWTAQCPKDFHVSPFNNMSGEYQFTFRFRSQQLYLGVDLHRQGHCVMKTWIQGNGHPVNNAAILHYALAHPFDTALNSMPRIIWQALQLYCIKRMQVYKRPTPHSPNTLINRDQPDGQRDVI